MVSSSTKSKYNVHSHSSLIKTCSSREINGSGNCNKNDTALLEEPEKKGEMIKVFLPDLPLKVQRDQSLAGVIRKPVMA